MLKVLVLKPLGAMAKESSVEVWKVKTDVADIWRPVGLQKFGSKDITTKAANHHRKMELVPTFRRMACPTDYFDRGAIRRQVFLNETSDGPNHRWLSAEVHSGLELKREYHQDACQG